MQAVTSLMFTALNQVLQQRPVTAVAFFGVYDMRQSFLFMPMNGLGQALISIAAYNYGAGKTERVRQADRITTISAAVIALIGTALFFLFGKQLLLLFAASEEMLQLGVPALRIISLTFLPASLTMITGYYRSDLGDGVTNMLSAILRQFLPLVSCAYLLARVTGSSSVWFAFWISEACGPLYALWRRRRTEVMPAVREDA